MLGAQRGGQVGLAHQGAVGQVAGVARWAVVQQPLAYRAPQAVCSDQGIAMVRVAQAVVHGDGLAVLREVRQCLAQLQVGLLCHGGV